MPLLTNSTAARPKVLDDMKFADEIGADFYGADAYECVQACNRLAR